MKTAIKLLFVTVSIALITACGGGSVESPSSTPSSVIPSGVVTTFAGPFSGSPTGAPGGVAVDSSGNVYVAEPVSNTIRKITNARVVTTFAGTAGAEGSTDGTGAAARFSRPTGVAVDSSGNVYVADTWNHTIRKITNAGVVTTFAGIAGARGSMDGTGAAARFNQPCCVAVDSSGNVYVAEFGSYKIRKITSAGVVTTFVGFFSGSPRGVAVDSSGNVYVGVLTNHTILKITNAGVVTTFAGNADAEGSTDGTGAAVRFSRPYGVAVDSSGNVYVAEGYDSTTIRKITP
jgi:sugar lactone lactonase YvrE